MKDETLLPCPFCGGKAEFDYDDDGINWISCSTCGVSTDTAYHTDVDARETLRDVWNRRALQSGNSAQPVTVPDEKLPLDYLQGQKDGLEWAAQMAEASHPQTGDWLYDDPLELAKAIRKGPDMPESPADGWIPVSERMPENNSYVSVVSRHGEYVSGLVNGEWLELHDGSSFPVSEIYLWLTLPCLPSKPLPDAPKGV